MRDYKPFLLLAGLAVLFVIWPIPHTSTIRETFLFISLLLALLAGRGVSARLTGLGAPLALYVLFLIWTLGVSALSAEAHWSLKEFKTQWVMGTLVLALGIGAGALAAKGRMETRQVSLLILLTLAFHVTFIVIDGLNTLVKTPDTGGASPGLTFLTRAVGGLTIGPIDASVLSSFLLMIVVTELVSRTAFKRRYLPLNNGLLAVLFLMAGAGSFVCGIRNITDIMALTAFCCLLTLLSGKVPLRKKLIFSAAIVVLSVLAVHLVFKSDKRWSALPETIEFVRSAANENSVLDALADPKAPPPVLPGGGALNMSNYLRLAKLGMGFDFVLENPLGIGFGRNAFGHGLRLKYGRDDVVGLNSDSSMMDLLIGTGIVGFFLWSSVLLSLLWMAVRGVLRHGGFFSIWLSMAIVGFGSRMAIDSVFRDHLLQQFLFLVGFLSVAMISENGSYASSGKDSTSRPPRVGPLIPEAKKLKDDVA